MHQAGVFPASGAIHAMMEIRSIVRHFFKKFLEGFCLPHETACWILYGVQNAALVAQPTQVCSNLVELVG